MRRCVAPVLAAPLLLGGDLWMKMRKRRAGCAGRRAAASSELREAENARTGYSWERERGTAKSRRHGELEREGRIERERERETPGRQRGTHVIDTGKGGTGQGERIGGLTEVGGR